MPRKGITGHDEWVITEALATALIALEQLPPNHQPRTHMDDIRKLLSAGCKPETVALHLAQAKCRLFPDKRLRLPRSRGNDGKALVSVDLAEINHAPLPARSPHQAVTP